MTEQEKALIAGCLKGEETAWNDFVRQYSGLIYHRIKTTLGSHYQGPPQHLIDDIFQDIFLSLVKDDSEQLRRFRGDHNCTLASWLRLIATRRTIDHLRKFNFQTELLEEPSEDHPAEIPERLLENEQLQLLAKAVQDLPARDKIVLDLFFREGLSTKDVAGILRMSVGAVYTQKNRILAKLKEMLSRANSL